VGLHADGGMHGELEPVLNPILQQFTVLRG
jgi:hypothetical protein